MESFTSRYLLKSLLKCKCGWAGTRRQLSVWLRNDAVVARICPSCGNKVIDQEQLTRSPKPKAPVSVKEHVLH